MTKYIIRTKPGIYDNSTHRTIYESRILAKVSASSRSVAIARFLEWDKESYEERMLEAELYSKLSARERKWVDSEVFKLAAKSQ